MDTTSANLIRESFAGANAVMASTNAALILSFYERLFSAAPQLRSMFPSDVVAQAQKLEQTLDFALASLSNLDLLVEPLRDLGARHVGYGVKVAHYAVMADVLTETLAEAWGPNWTHEHDAAWRELFAFITEKMIEGASESERPRNAPATHTNSYRAISV